MRLVLVATSMLLAASAAAAQPPLRCEISASIGYTFSEGFEFSPVEVGDYIYSEADPESGLSFGASFGVLVNRFVELGFLMSQQQSTFIAGGRGPDLDLVDLDVNNFHGYLAYNIDLNPQVVPYVLFGMGATHYVTGDFEGIDVDNETRFSTTWGGGVKIFPAGRLGARFAGRWTPTYIKTDAEAWWCDPWGCWTVGNADYAHQVEISAGAIYRF